MGRVRRRSRCWTLITDGRPFLTDEVKHMAVFGNAEWFARKRAPG
jgi:hypothetical protein